MLPSCWWLTVVIFHCRNNNVIYYLENWKGKNPTVYKISPDFQIQGYAEGVYIHPPLGISCSSHQVAVKLMPRHSFP